MSLHSRTKTGRCSLRIAKKALLLTTLWISVCLAAEAIDAEIIKNLDLYENMEVVQHLDMALHQKTDGTLNLPAPTKSNNPSAMETDKK